MQKNRLTLHIGMPKTGTTTIQKTLCLNGDTLEKMDIIYPEVGQRYRAHHLFVDPLVQQKNVIRPDPYLDSEALIASIMQFTNQSKHVILSSEAFASATQILSPLKQLSESFDLQVIIFFREQTYYAISQANQHLKMRLYNPEYTLDFVLDRNAIPRSYVEIARLWRDSLPKACISIVTLGPGDDAWLRFAETVDTRLCEITPSTEYKSSNISLDANALAFIHWLAETSREKSLDEKNRIMSILTDYSREKKKASVRQQTPIPHAKLEEIQCVSKPINETLAREFCGGNIRFGTPPDPYDFEYIDLRTIPIENILEVADYVFERYDQHFRYLRGRPSSPQN